MDELTFIMQTKLISRYNDRIGDFFNLIEEYVEKMHGGGLTGIRYINYDSVAYTWQKTIGCYGCYTTTYTEEYTDFSDILSFIQGEKK